VLVCDYVALGERPSGRAEAVVQLVEEAQVDVDVLVGRAVERADVRARRTAAGLPLTALEVGDGGHVGSPAVRELALPEPLHRVDVADDAAVLAGIGIGTRAAFREVARRSAGGRLVLQAAELTEAPAATQHLEQQDDDDHADPEATAAGSDAPTAEPAAQAAAAALVAHL